MSNASVVEYLGVAYALTAQTIKSFKYLIWFSSITLLMHPLVLVYYKNNDGVLDKYEKRKLALFFIPSMVYYSIVLVSFVTKTQATGLELAVSLANLLLGGLFDYLAGMMLAPSISLIFPDGVKGSTTTSSSTSSTSPSASGKNDHDWGLANDSAYKKIIELKKKSTVELSADFATADDVQAKIDQIQKMNPNSSGTSTYKTLFNSAKGDLIAELNRIKSTK
jgi:hypothetical protein